MKRIAILGALLGLLLALGVSSPANAKVTGTYWKCVTNHATSLGKGGTTRVHIHHTRPSKQHRRRHHCVKRTRKGTAKVITVPAPAKVVTVEKIVYVTVPCIACQPDPQADPCNCDRHTHTRGEGHRKCRGQGHRED